MHFNIQHVPALCTVDGSWSVWGAWSTCSATCGTGVTSRDRNCDQPAPQHNGADCPGDSTETRACDTISCPSTINFSYNSSELIRQSIINNIWYFKTNV